MREKFLLIIIIILVIGAGGLGYSLYQQNEKISELSTIVASKYSDTQKIVEPASDLAVKPEAQVTSGRSQFGSQISPDGKWLLTETRAGDTLVEHSLILKGLYGQGEKVVYTFFEQRTEKFTAITGKPFPTVWKTAGWSADGTKVYFVSSAESEGCGGFYPEQMFTGSKLHEVTLDTSKEKVLIQVPASGCGGFYGIHDVYALKNVIVFSKTTGAELKYEVFVSDLTGGAQKRLTELSNTDGLTAAVLSPDATRALVVTNKLVDLGEDQYYDYTFWNVAVADGKKKEVPLSDEATFKGWNSNNEIIIENVGKLETVKI